jgi:hypothetical protein
MAREVFPYHPGKTGGKQSGKKLTVSTENLVRRTVVALGDYVALVRKAELVETSPGNISVVLELADPESGDLYDLRALWISGPHAQNGSMASRNASVVTAMLAAMGIPSSAYREINDELLGKLIGRLFELTLDVDRGARGGSFNIIAAVHREVDPGDIVPFPNPAAQ